MQRVRFSHASLFTAAARAIYGAIITTDRLLYHPANILGGNPIAAQPLHPSWGLRRWPGEEVCLQETYLPELLGPGIPAHPLFMARLCPPALPAEPSAVGAGENGVGLFSTGMPVGIPMGICSSWGMLEGFYQEHKQQWVSWTERGSGQQWGERDGREVTRVSFESSVVS